MNTTLQFKVDNHKITFIDNTFLTTGNKNIVECKFDFSNEWNNVHSFAMFYCGENKYIVEITNNICNVPNEILTNSYTTIFSVSCYSGDLRTTNKASVQMILGGDTEPPEPLVPEPDIATYVMSLDQHVQFIRNNNGELEWYDGVYWNSVGSDGGGIGDVTQQQLINEINAHNSDLSSHNDIRNAINNKQDKLVSGTNIRTINGTSLLGSGNINITGGDGGGSGGGIQEETDPIYTADKPNIALKSELFSRDYNDLSNKPTIPTIPTVPTKTSDLANDSGYVTVNDIPKQRNFTTTPINLTNEVAGVLPSDNVNLSDVQGQINVINDIISDINDVISNIDVILQAINGEVIL